MPDAEIEIIDRLVSTLGLPTEFFRQLIRDVKESDWSFVIKLHALVEAALTHLLASTSPRPGVDTVYALLDTSDERTGKLAFVKALGLLSSDHRKYVKILGQIRNAFVHDVKNVGMTLSGYLDKQEKTKVGQFVEACALGMSKDYFEIRGKRIPKGKFFRENPRLGLWLGGMTLLVEIYIQREAVTLELDRGRVRNAFLKVIEPEVPPMTLRDLMSLGKKPAEQ